MAPSAPRSPLFWLFTAIVAAYLVWVLSLPVFPSQDGPMHLYLANIMRQTLAHVPGEYSRLFYVRDYLPPYALYYYALIGLGAMMPLEQADKCIICISMVLFAFGFRFLVRRLTLDGTLTSDNGIISDGISFSSEAPAFLILPVLLNWPLMMGFVNFYLSLALGLWALGLWCTRVPHLHYSHRRKIFFLAILYVMMLTHAVPLLFVLCFCCFEMAVRAWLIFTGRHGLGRACQLQHLIRDAMYAAGGACAFLYVRLFLTPNPLVQSQPGTFLQLTLVNLTNYLHGKGLMVFSNNAWPTMLYRAGLGVVLLGALVLGIRHVITRARRLSWGPAETWVVFSTGFLLVLPLIPRDFNGAHYFALRLATVVFVAIVAGAGNAVASLRRSRSFVVPAAVVVCVASSLFTLGLAFARLSPISRSVATLFAAPGANTLQPGLLLRANGETLRTDVPWDPYFWAGVHYFRRNNLLMYNSPWLQQSQIPVKLRPNVVSPLEPTFDEETPSLGARYLETDAQERATLARVGFLLVMRDGASPEQNALAFETGDDKPVPAGEGWRCSGRGIYSVCLPPVK